MLRLEQQRGHDNRAVVGGLSALVERLDVPSELSTELVELVRQYGELTEDERSRIAYEVLAALDQTQNSRLALQAMLFFYF